MKVNKVLKINGSILDKKQLEQHLQKIASNHNLSGKSDKNTYPIPQMLESFKVIQEVYNLLNEHLKLGITIHPAGEWLLDNFYIIEETVRQIERELTLKKYTNFVGILNGQYKGFARIYVLASEIVAYTDNKIDKKDLENYLISYQTKRTLSMEEIWNIGIFLQIAIIENIREICEKIYSSQMQKYKAENIVERLIENKPKSEMLYRNSTVKKIEKSIIQDIKYPFVEYMSYILKRYGKKGYGYLSTLEEIMEMAGTTVSEVIKKEHFDIAVNKVSIGNSITSIKKIQRINFLQIFEKINGVEEILKQDPANVYSIMDNKTKEYYRNKIKEISKKTKTSEIYIAKKVLEIAKKNNNITKGEKQSHIGYYLIDKGISELYDVLKIKSSKKVTTEKKVKIYVFSILLFTTILSIIITYFLNTSVKSIWINILSFFILLIPVSELVTQVIQYCLSKIVKPNIIPKIDLLNKVPKDKTTMVVIPTILNSKEKVDELVRKLEVYYLANKSENLYFTLLGDCTQSNNLEESFDKDIIEEGTKQIENLNNKYSKKFKDIQEDSLDSEVEIPIFNFIYRNRVWNEKENSYLGWERKRGMLNQLNEYLLGNIEDPFRVNTMSKFLNKSKRRNFIKYIITLDSDTDLILNSAFELIGAMSHILNKPI